jgi:hypothetical protein
LRSEVGCGGTVCEPHVDAKVCELAGDCSSQCIGTVCTPCFNGATDGVERGSDCDGPIPMADAPDGCKNLCDVGVACAANRDCGTGKCGAENTYEVLTPADTCLGDAFAVGAVALLETDEDCGGKQCREADATCADAQYCDVNGDCTSGRPVHRQRLHLLLEHESGWSRDRWRL